jgi:hypothetical protein
MKRIVLVVTLSAVTMLPAAAQATRTYVSGMGDDVNPCSRTAPCKTFPGAISKTAAGGEIDALDPGGFGAVTITKAITIAQEGTGEGGILVAGTNGITINAGVNDSIVLRGLQIDGGPIGSNSLSGIRFIQGGSLTVQNCVIRNFTGAGPNGYGILFNPSSASSLFVSDTQIHNNGVATTGGGIMIQPSASGSAKATLVRVNTINNTVGIRADGTGSTAGISVSISDSTSAENVYSGITAFSPPGGAPVRMTVTRTVSSNNGTGVNANGTGASMWIGYSTIFSNSTGATISNGATMGSFGNNLIEDNTNMGSSIPLLGTL